MCATRYKRRKLLSHLLLGGLGILVALLILELAARAIFKLRELREVQAAEQFRQFFQNDEQLEWFHVAGATGEFRDFNSGEFTHKVRINSLGLHDSESTYENPSDATRILLLGDSFAEGLHVPLEYTSQQLLEESLNRELYLGPLEIINGGVSGYGPGHELMLYRAEGRKYQADLVLLYFFIGNDLEDEVPSLAQRWFWPIAPRNTFFELANGALQQVQLPEVPIGQIYIPSNLNLSLADRVDGFLLANSRLYALLRPGLTGNLPWLRSILVRLHLLERAVPVDGKYGRDISTPAYDQAWAIVAALLEELARETAADGAQLAVVIVPDRYQVHPDWLLDQFRGYENIERYYDFEKPNRQLTALLDRANIPYLDLLPAFVAEAEATSTDLYYRQEGHWDEAGNALAANEISAWLRESELLTDALSSFNR